MTQLQTILEPILDDLSFVDEKLKDFSQSSDLPSLDKLLKHVFASKGKRARPALTILASGFHPHDKSNVITMAAAVEMLHVATLIHDDTVDEADTRRGRITISSGWGDRIAVLVGDYVFAASATFVCDTGDIQVIRRFSETIMELSRGELQEISLSGNVDGNISEYLQRIYFKTGSLFATSGESGARLSGADIGIVRILTDYSRKIGTAFQIIDDILDFEADEISLGKPVGSDLLNGIVTLPTIFAMEDNNIQNLVRRYFEEGKHETILEELVNLIRESNAINRAQEYAENLSREARESLTSLPANRSRESLEELTHFIVRRIS